MSAKTEFESVGFDESTFYGIGENLDGDGCLRLDGGESGDGVTGKHGEKIQKQLKIEDW